MALSTDGHLRPPSGDKAGPRFAYQDFNGRIGESDIHGSPTTTGKPRPVEGDLESRAAKVADLGPLIGVDSGGKGRKPNSVKVIPLRSRPEKCCRMTALETDKWAGDGCRCAL